MYTLKYNMGFLVCLHPIHLVLQIQIHLYSNLYILLFFNSYIYTFLYIGTSVCTSPFSFEAVLHRTSCLGSNWKPPEREAKGRRQIAGPCGWAPGRRTASSARMPFTLPNTMSSHSSRCSCSPCSRASPTFISWRRCCPSHTHPSRFSLSHTHPLRF
jgi:hypothetical protein